MIDSRNSQVQQWLKCPAVCLNHVWTQLDVNPSRPCHPCLHFLEPRKCFQANAHQERSLQFASKSEGQNNGLCQPDHRILLAFVRLLAPQTIPRQSALRNSTLNANDSLQFEESTIVHDYKSYTMYKCDLQNLQWWHPSLNVMKLLFQDRSEIFQVACMALTPQNSSAQLCHNMSQV